MLPDTAADALTEFETALEEIPKGMPEKDRLEKEKHALYEYFNINLVGTIKKLTVKFPGEKKFEAFLRLINLRIKTSKVGPMEVWAKYMKGNERLFEKLTPESWVKILKLLPTITPLKVFQLHKYHVFFSDKELQVRHPHQRHQRANTICRVS